MTDAAPRRRSLWTYAIGLAPVILVWAALATWLAVLILDRATLTEAADEASLREWLDEARNFRKTLPELIREAVVAREEEGGASDRVRLKLEEIKEHLQALNEPLRVYQNQLPLFPDVFRIEVLLNGSNHGEAVVEYDSGLPRPRGETKDPIQRLEYRPLGPNDPHATIRCDYRVHALNKLQQREEDRQRRALLAEAVLGAATVLAVLFVIRFLRREQKAETQRLEAIAAAEHRDRELAEARVQQDAIERELLRKQLDAKELEARAAAAEAAAADMRTHLFANIGIMAGSYAHNIKNLLVRPNDLLARCVEANGLSNDQAGMLSEVRSTLGTVTERLQQILSAVRRDPTAIHSDRIDLNDLVREAGATWIDLAREKWKVTLSIEPIPESLPIRGDRSNLQQVLENLLFNGRDATFEMRNALREDVRNSPELDAIARRDRLIAAAAWKGEIVIRTRREGNGAILDVIDNGIGMTEQVKANCLETHFSTKRDNALYEGHAAGMGLGLSFVAVVLEHHRATLVIDSSPRKGTTFRILFPIAG
jgi:signal transduction histidine kinase